MARKVKLVRDKIPARLTRQGIPYQLRQPVDPGEKAFFYLEKLKEEVDEYVSSGDWRELVDVMEVCYSIASKLHHVDPAKLDKARRIKADDRGMFNNEYIIEFDDSAPVGLRTAGGSVDGGLDPVPPPAADGRILRPKLDGLRGERKG